MIKKNNKEVGFIEKGTTNIDKIYKGTNLVFEQGFDREDSGSTPLTTSHEAIGKDLKGYKVYGNSIQDGTPTPSSPIEIESVGDKTVNVMPSAEKSIKQENGITIECDGFGTYIITGTASYDTTIYFDLKSSFTIPVSKSNGGEGTMSLFNSDSSPSVYIYFMNNSSTIDYWILYQINRISNSYLTQGGKKCNKIGLKVLEGKTVNMTVSPVFTNDGIYPSESIPYGYKIPITVSDGTNSTTTNIYLSEPLRKIGDYADYIDFKNQKIIRTIEEKIITGTEAWSDVSGSSKKYYRFNIGNYGYVIPSQGLCNNYMRDSIISTNTVVGFNVVNVTSLNKSVISIRPENVADYTVGTFKQYLADKYNNGKPIIVYYPLATPTEQTISLPNIPSLVGTTIYDVDTKVKPSNMYIKYKGK